MTGDDAIEPTDGAPLSDVNVAVGVTGSIAAVRVVQLAHELRRQGASVRAVTTPAAGSILHPWALHFATDAPVVTELTGAIEHVELCGREGWADVFLIAPATANTIGSMASAVDDTPVTTCATTAIGSGLPVIVAPAMHEPMYDHPGVLEAIERLESWGLSFADPVIAEGKAKMASDEAISAAVARAAGDRPLSGRHVVVTAGATSEAIDPVRVLTSRASGRTGRAVARACYARGASVTLVHGHLAGRDAIDVPWATLERVEGTDELRDRTLSLVEHADAFVSAAAIGDYTVETSPTKLSSGEPRSIELEPAPKVLDAVRESCPDLPIVGFKTEAGIDEDGLIEAARSLRSRVDAAFVVANDAAVMGEAETRATLVTAEATDSYSGEKAGLGGTVAERLAAVLG
jgi:phosphopantothenoylcysteine decarboxylase/phosphopantothenate--cysteine ligase